MANRYHPDIDFEKLQNGKKLTADLLYKQLTIAIRRDAIENKDMAIVSERQLGNELEIDRSVVHRVYERLKAAGLLQRASGTRKYILCPIRNASVKDYPCLGIVFPMRFSDYITMIESRQRRQSVYNGIVDRAAELGFSTYPIMLPEVNASEEKIQKYFKTILPRVRGIIHLGDRGKIEFDSPLKQLLEHDEVPQVFISSWTTFKYIGSVSYDTASAVNCIAHYLKEFGHRKLGIVKAFRNRQHALCHYDMNSMSELEQLFRGTDMEVRKEWTFSGILQSEVSTDNLDDALAKWFDELFKQQEYPTAFWCRGDFVAMKLISHIRRLGYNVPGDFSVIGMDDTREAENCNPPLTTLRQPMYDSGVYAVNMLFDFIQHGARNCVRSQRLPMTLVARNSVAHCSKLTEISIAMNY